MTTDVRNIYLFAIAALSLAACSSNDWDGNEPVAARITATIGNSAASRAAGTSWTPGDRIGVTTRSGAGSKYVNMEYATEAGDGKFTGTPMYFKEANDEVTFTAYYPYAGTEGTDPAIIEGNTRAPQQTADNQPAIDYLWDSRPGKKVSPDVSFEFAHRMSRITLTFQEGTASGVDKIGSYSLDGLVVEGTFNTATGEAKAKDINAETLKLSVDNAASGIALPSVIVYPQTASRPVVLSIVKEGETYQCELPIAGGALKAGTDYHFTVTLNKKSLAVSSCTISAWGDGGSFTGDADIKVPARIGDFFYSDGTYSGRLDADKTCIGIVFWTPAYTNPDPDAISPASLTDDKIMAADHPHCTHGLVVALNDAADGVSWMNSVDYSIYNDFQNSENFSPKDKELYRPIASSYYVTDEINYILGYQNTKILKAYKEWNDGSAPAVHIIDALEEYSAQIPAPQSTTGWFIPSPKELALLINTDQDNVDYIRVNQARLDFINNMLVEANGAELPERLWSSTEFTRSPRYCFYMITRYYIDYEYKIDKNALRPVLAF